MIRKRNLVFFPVANSGNTDINLIHDFSTVDTNFVRMERCNASQREANAFPAVI